MSFGWWIGLTAEEFAVARESLRLRVGERWDALQASQERDEDA